MILLTTFLLLATEPAETPAPENKTTIPINLKERATDYIEAFDALKREKGVGKVFFQLSGGTTISNIVQMNLMENGHLILFKFNSPQGIKYQVVPVEQITALSYLP